MKLLEHEAKSLLEAAGLPIPKGTLITSINQALKPPLVLKSQVPVGGRGKLGGVLIVKNTQEITPTIAHLLSHPIKGSTPRSILAEELIAIQKEFYISLLIDRETASIRLVAHAKGGIEVESNIPGTLFNKTVTADTVQERADELASYLSCSPLLIKPFVNTLFRVFTAQDATLIEINPLILTASNTLVCGDAKIELDDAALFRHPDWHFEDTPSNANFVTLHDDGAVATIANGAGLAMATVDAVAANNMRPANFLDIGGGANTDSILTAFKQIVEYPNVKTIVINIFAGITRCDEVAKAIIEAKKQIPHLPPLFIRLAGTNFKEAKLLLVAENIPTLASLDECLDAAKEVVYA